MTHVTDQPLPSVEGSTNEPPLPGWVSTMRWSQTGAMVAAQICTITLPLAAVKIANASIAQVGVVAAARFAPFAVAFIVGVIVDRLSCRRAMVIGECMNVAAALILCGLTVTNMLTVSTLVIGAAMLGFGDVMYNIAYATYATRFQHKHFLVRINGNLFSGDALGRFVGPVLAGLFIYLGAGIAFLAASLASCLALSLLPKIPIDTATVEAKETKWQTSLKQGAAILSSGRLRQLLFASITFNVTIALVLDAGIHILFANKELGLSPTVLGIAIAIGNTGYLLGTLGTPALERRFGLIGAMMLMPVIAGSGIALLSVANGSHLIAAVLFGLAIWVTTTGIGVGNVAGVTIRQLVTPNWLQASVTGIIRSLIRGIIPIGTILGGLLATQVGFRWAILYASIGIALSGLWLLQPPAKPKCRKDPSC